MPSVKGLIGFQPFLTSAWASSVFFKTSSILFGIVDVSLIAFEPPFLLSSYKNMFSFNFLAGGSTTAPSLLDSEGLTTSLIFLKVYSLEMLLSEFSANNCGTSYL
ncbi:hypothetical protein IKD56_03635 [bacterium]|nr:hypothetical protein [bacterium]